MQDHLSSLATPFYKENDGDKRPHLPRLQNWLTAHPWLGTILLFVYFIVLLRVVSFSLTPLVAHWHLTFIQKELIGESVYVLITLVPLALLGWWSRTGFTRGIRGKDLVLYIAPFLFLVGVTFFVIPAILAKSNTAIIITAVVIVVLVGITEEGFFRGILLQSSLRIGIWPSVLISSALFALAHISNVFSGITLNYIIAQILLGFSMGVVLAALRLRSGSIWPGILLHAAHDFPGILQLAINPHQVLNVSLTAALLGGGLYCVFLLPTTFILLRPRKARELRIVYGLDPAPTQPVIND